MEHEIGVKLKEFKKKHFLTTQALADILGISKSMTDKYLSRTFIGSDRVVNQLTERMSSYEKQLAMDKQITSESESNYGNNDHFTIPYREMWEMLKVQMNIIASQQTTIHNLSESR